MGNSWGGCSAPSAFDACRTGSRAANDLDDWLPEVEDPALQEALLMGTQAPSKAQGPRSGVTHPAAASSGPGTQQVSAARMEAVLQSLGLRRLDVGATNLNEGHQMIGNQCFYLALARSWLGGGGRGRKFSLPPCCKVNILCVCLCVS